MDGTQRPPQSVATRPLAECPSVREVQVGTKRGIHSGRPHSPLVLGATQGAPLSTVAYRLALTREVLGMYLSVQSQRAAKLYGLQGVP